jgi:hypothetical protein
MRTAPTPTILALWAAACAGPPPEDQDITDAFEFPSPGDNIGSGTSETEDAPPPPGDGTIAGSYGIFVERTCTIVWSISGYQLYEGELAWAVELLDPTTDCSDVGETWGELSVFEGAASFERNYIGQASYAGGALSWSTRGYIPGAGGGNYYYAGASAYD